MLLSCQTFVVVQTSLWFSLVDIDPTLPDTKHTAMLKTGPWVWLSWQTVAPRGNEVVSACGRKKKTYTVVGAVGETSHEKQHRNLSLYIYIYHYISIYLPIDLSIYLSIHLSIYLSIYLSDNRNRVSYMILDCMLYLCLLWLQESIGRLARRITWPKCYWSSGPCLILDTS